MTVTRLSDGRGSIPLTDYSQDPNFLTALQDGHWLVAAEGNTPAACIDGRPSEHSSPRFPRSAGGTIGLWVAVNLTCEEPTPMFEVMDRLASSHLPIGDHTGPHPTQEASGCGAADFLPHILALLQADTVRDLTESWGFRVDLLDAQMLERAADLAESGFTGPALVAPLLAAPGTHVPRLLGEHRESAALINHRAGTTIDGGALAASSADEPQVFQIDVWAFAPVAEALFPDRSPLQERFQTALASFNAAAVLALVQPDFPAVDNA